METSITSGVHARRPPRFRRICRICLTVLAGMVLLPSCGGEPGNGADGQVTTDASSFNDAKHPQDGTLYLDGGLLHDAADSDAGVPDPPPITVGLISDLNGSYGSTTYGAAVHGAVAQLVAVGPDLVLSAGDMVAGQQSGLDYEAMWLAFHAAVTDPLTEAGIPLAVTPGNHDASGYAGFAEERAEYERQWLSRLPAVTFLDDDAYPFRYAFSMGGVLFVSLDATRVGPLSADHRAWLDALLTQEAPLHDATVVFGHLPLYAVAVGRETEILNDATLEAILEDHGVALYISGHHHAYYPGRRASVRHLSMGCLGSGPRTLVGTSEISDRSLVLFTIHRGEILSLEAYPAPGFDAPIPRDSLPATIGTDPTAYARDDS